MIKNKKSVGMIAISIAEITIGIYGVFWSLIMIFSLSKHLKDFNPYRAAQFQGIIPLSIVNLICALMVIFLGVSLFKSKRIIRLLHLTLSPLIAIFIVNALGIYVLLLISHLKIPFLLNLNDMIILIVMIIVITLCYMYYFTRPKVKEQFGS